MKKAGPVVYLVVIGLVLGVGGLLVFAMKEDKAEAREQQATQTEQAANAQVSQGMTKAELEERQEHLKRTQAALIAAAEEEEAEAKTKASAQQAAREDAEDPKSSSPGTKSTGSGKSTASKAPPKPQPKPVDNKKSLDGLDALGADITSALE